MKTPTWKTATRMIPTRQFPLGKLPPKNIVSFHVNLILHIYQIC